MKREYDFILAGGGVAGLSLAYHLIRSPLRDRSILIIDREIKQRNDRTLCFWSDEPTEFDRIVYRCWDKIHFVGEGFGEVVDLERFRYKMIRAFDFYQFVHDELKSYPNVEFLTGDIERIEDGTSRAKVYVDGQVYTARWAFDSRFKWNEFNPDPEHFHSLRQYFKGWVIETDEPAFDPQAATFLDFRTPQKREMRFFYVLPFSERQALVEYVLLSRDKYSEALKDYIEDVLGIQQYRIVSEEGGVSPLTDWPFARRAGLRVMTLGTLGGRVKPSSGYAFTRIQQDSEAIVQSLVRRGHPFRIPVEGWFYRLCDSLMLQVMYRQGEYIKRIFTLMFKNNPVERVFHFLDEVTTPWENLQMMLSLPPWIFLAALFRVKVLRRV